MTFPPNQILTGMFVQLCSIEDIIAGHLTSTGCFVSDFLSQPKCNSGTGWAWGLGFF